MEILKHEKSPFEYWKKRITDKNKEEGLYSKWNEEKESRFNFYI